MERWATCGRWRIRLAGATRPCDMVTYAAFSEFVKRNDSSMPSISAGKRSIKDALSAIAPLGRIGMKRAVGMVLALLTASGYFSSQSFDGPGYGPPNMPHSYGPQPPNLQGAVGPYGMP